MLMGWPLRARLSGVSGTGPLVTCSTPAALDWAVGCGVCEDCDAALELAALATAGALEAAGAALESLGGAGAGPAAGAAPTTEDERASKASPHRIDLGPTRSL